MTFATHAREADRIAGESLPWRGPLDLTDHSGRTDYFVRECFGHAYGYITGVRELPVTW